MFSLGWTSPLPTVPVSESYPLRASPCRVGVGSPSSVSLSPGPGLLHILPVDNPVCFLRVAFGWGQCPALHHAARR